VAVPEPATPAAVPAIELQSLDAQELERFLDRRRAGFSPELSLTENLLEVLRKANEFVPSAAGSILLDDPREKYRDRRRNSLTFIAAFGDKAAELIGQKIPADRGIAGRTYLTGEAYSTDEASRDPHFYAGVDRSIRYTTHTVVAIPVRIEHEVCGVLELVNRQQQDGFSASDRNLLQIFASYISISIQNVLDGRQAQEIARRDNLTGLYNDRYLHVALTRSIHECRGAGTDLSLLFLDLDFFKRVNDTHGHLAGSQVLREVGALLGARLERAEGIAARYGGDEFVLVVPGLDLDGAIDLAEETRNEINLSTFCEGAGDIQPDPLHLGGLTCSIGVATLKRHLTEELSEEECRSAILRLADAAMYVAKETGRNRTAVAGQPVRRRS
jgi:diguanylate cyclase (GGDEF)-like protein